MAMRRVCVKKRHKPSKPSKHNTPSRPSQQPTEDSRSDSEYEDWEGEPWHSREKQVWSSQRCCREPLFLEGGTGRARVAGKAAERVRPARGAGAHGDGHAHTGAGAQLGRHARARRRPQALLSSVAGIDTHGGRRHIGQHRRREWAAVQQRRRPALRVAAAGETEVSSEGQRRGHEAARPSVSMSGRSFCRKKRTWAGRGQRSAASAAAAEEGQEEQVACRGESEGR